MRTIQFEFNSWANSVNVIRGAMSTIRQPVTEMLVDGEPVSVDDTVQAIHGRCVAGGLHLSGLDEVERGVYLATYHDAEAEQFMQQARVYDPDARLCMSSWYKHGCA